MAKKTETKKGVKAEGFNSMFKPTNTTENQEQETMQPGDTPAELAAASPDPIETPKKKRKSPEKAQEPNAQGLVRYTFLADADMLQTIKYMAKLTGRNNSETINDAIRYYLSKKWTDGHKTAAAQLKRLIS